MKIEPSYAWVDRSTNWARVATIRKVELRTNAQWKREEIVVVTDIGAFTPNAGNKNRLCELFGYESDDWIGKQFTLTAESGKLTVGGGVLRV